MAYREEILLVESGNAAVRVVSVTQRNVKELIERMRLDPAAPAKVHIRTWRNTNGERDLTGQLRVFREVLPEPEPEPVEKPRYDELVLKTPIPLTEHES